MRRAIALLVLIFVVSLFSIYVSSVRADVVPPCNAANGFWKYGYCHNGHSICTGELNKIRAHTIHLQQKDPGCVWLGCCDAPDGEFDSTPNPF